MHLAITDTTNNIGGMVARHLSTRGLPLILPLPPPPSYGTIMRIFIYNRLGNKPMKPKILLIGLALAIAAAIGLYLLMNAHCYQLLGNLVCHGADERKRIALTFDDAPSERTSDAVLAVLAEKNVKATFFMIGENIERYPQAAHRRRRTRNGQSLLQPPAFPAAFTCIHRARN